MRALGLLILKAVPVENQTNSQTKGIDGGITTIAPSNDGHSGGISASLFMTQSRHPKDHSAFFPLSMQISPLLLTTTS